MLVMGQEHEEDPDHARDQRLKSQKSIKPN